MSTLEQTPRIEQYGWEDIIDAIDKKLAGRALYLTVQEPADPQTAALLGEQPGVLASRVDDEKDLSWQLWQDHVSAKQTYSDDTDTTSSHFSIIRGDDGIVVYPYPAERSGTNA